jgi:CRISPR-associated protein Cmr6
MPIAAVPGYLGQDFASTSPGMRFGMYLAIWTDRSDQEREITKAAQKQSREGQELSAILRQKGMDATIAHIRGRRNFPGLWEKNTDAATEAWQKVAKMNADDLERGRELLRRQQACAAVYPEIFQLDATAIAPFTTGLGNEHPLENGFAFLWPYGLPYLPGSGVKGVVRRAAQELASGEWGDTRGWSTGKAYTLTLGKEGIGLSVLDVLFGLESGNGETEHVRGALSFWDVIPQIKGNSLIVEVMTPHQSHYYQQGKPDPRSGNSTSPHDSGQPNPITFLTVPAGSQFTFHVVCDRLHLKRLTANRTEGAIDLLAEDNGMPRWQQLLAAAFEHAFAWLGFGAKTAVGYGAMETAAMHNEREARWQQHRQSEVAQAKAAEAARQEAEAVAWAGARLKFNRANKALTAEKDNKQAVAIAPKGEALLATLPPEIRRKVETNQFVRVTAYVANGELIRIEA